MDIWGSLISRHGEFVHVVGGKERIWWPVIDTFYIPHAISVDEAWLDTAESKEVSESGSRLQRSRLNTT